MTLAGTTCTYLSGVVKMVLSDEMINRIAERVAEKTASKVLRVLNNKQRDEISTSDIVREYGVSKTTIRRRRKAGVLPTPVVRHNQQYYPRSAVERADLRCQL